MAKPKQRLLRFCAKATTLVLTVAGLALLLAPRAFRIQVLKLIVSPESTDPSDSLREGDDGEGESPEGDVYWAMRRGLQFGVPPTAYRAARVQKFRMEAASAMQLRSRALTGAPATDFTWDFIGPMPMLNNVPNFGGKQFKTDPLTNSQGRVTAVAADPTTPGRLFVGTAGGGVWMTTDGGNSFTPIFDDQPSLAIGAIVLDPDFDPSRIYVGTGDGNGSSDSYYGQGIFMSEDLGASWTELAPGTPTSPGPFDRMGIARLAIDSNSPPHLFAAVTGAVNDNRAGANFFEANPVNEGLWRSLDGGNTWTTHYSAATFGCQRAAAAIPALRTTWQSTPVTRTSFLPQSIPTTCFVPLTAATPGRG